MISAADGYALQQDYQTAISIINEALLTIPEDTELINYKNDCRTAIITQADTVLKEEGYQSAIDIASQGLNIFPNDVILLNKIEEYKTYMPVDLLGLETFSGKPLFEVGPITDTFGNECNSAYLQRTYYGDKEFSYLLNGEYNTLNGELFWSKDDKDNQSGYYYLMFYEGDHLLYTTAQCNYLSTPIEFSCEISNVQILTIKFVGFSNDGPFLWGATITVQK